MSIVAGKNTRSKLFHYTDCKYAKRINPDNRIRFRAKSEALELGYTQCSCCSRIKKYYNENKANIDKYIMSHGLKMYMDSDSMYIENVFSCWKITTDAVGYNLVLYHGNSESYHRLKKKNGKLVHHYHKQKYKGRLNILPMLKYIVEHDKWRVDNIDSYKNMPKRTKKQKKAYERAKNSARKKKIKNVLNLIDRMKLEH